MESKYVSHVGLEVTTSTSFVCPTCGSREYDCIGDKIRCKCCYNIYDKSEENPSLMRDIALADYFRQMTDFNRAKTIYKRVIEENPESDLTAAYWGMYLCDNNVIFEKDGAGNIFPSFYKVIDEQSSENEFYQKAIDCSVIYHSDKTVNLIALANKIDDARNKYKDISLRNDPYDIFICFKNDNGSSLSWAKKIYSKLAKKYKVFFSEETLKNIKSIYRDYEPNIYYALYTAKVMLVICKDRSDLESQWVQNEWLRFSEINRRESLGKAIIPIFIDGFDPNSLPETLWHTQGFSSGPKLIANLKDQLKEYLSFTSISNSKAKKDKNDDNVNDGKKGRNKKVHSSLCKIQGYIVTASKHSLKGELSIPDGIMIIGDKAFYGCGLTSVTIPNSVKTIGCCAFAYCENLSSVTLSDGVTTIGAGAFEGCRSLSGITIPGSVTTIGSYSFVGCSNLINLKIQNGVKKIDSCAFHGCTYLTNVTIPNSVKEIGEYAFGECKYLKTIYYDGTESQWNRLQKDYYWDSSNYNHIHGDYEILFLRS